MKLNRKIAQLQCKTEENTQLARLKLAFFQTIFRWTVTINPPPFSNQIKKSMKQNISNFNYNAEKKFFQIYKGFLNKFMNYKWL